MDGVCLPPRESNGYASMMYVILDALIPPNQVSLFVRDGMRTMAPAGTKGTSYPGSCCQTSFGETQERGAASPHTVFGVSVSAEDTFIGFYIIIGERLARG